ncbi:hypothetical protein COCMIDRAFT_29524 [Bipolaris oryzae ATCC 44560]|uniref:Uncharacterized protein n=1 Tax=Bipolaris oryzae ATCC 44560 TaxID=930090 RepID=W6ZE08_COCMI|nr:uncharacterized protein COCMIDRAFT_29524 [Bipolaris oryzae ATCC 44560]EUC41746.1 hypothetical protein COCMIDRAFT_29524 [Bipolaris oryzae ATCC 44560]
MPSSAVITSDAELMWNVLPAVALPSHSKFLTARDRNGQPMVFGVGTDSILRVAQESPKDRLRQLVDLHKKLNLPADALVDGFDLYQANDDTIYLAVTYHTKDEARLAAAQPFLPADVDFTDDTTTLPYYRSLRLDDMKVKDLLLGNFIGVEQFPPIILNYTNAATRSDNVKHYEIVADQVTNEGDLSLPLNASSIIGMVVGKIKRHTGVFVLFTQKEQRVLMFSSWTTQFDSTLVCPPNAGYVAALPNSKGNSDLIVGGDGIWHFTSQSMLARDAQGHAICQGPEFLGINDMHIAMTATKASIWATTGESGVSYVEIDASKLDGNAHPAAANGVPLLPSGQGGGIAGYLGPHGSNAVFVSDKKNQMSYFEQAVDTKLWKQTPFWFPSLEKTLQIHCYMTRIVAHDENGGILPKCWVKLTSTGTVNVVANGLPVTLDASPFDIQADEEGAVSIINPTNDISTYQFKVVEVFDADNKTKIPLAQTGSINPAAKLELSLSNMSVDRLSTATTANGESVFDNKDKASFETAVAALKEFDTARAELEKTATARIANVQLGGISKPTLAVSSAADGSVLGKIKDTFWDAWHFIVSSWDKVKAWAIEVYNEVKAFVIKIGEQSYRFILKTATQIAKAANFIYTKYLKAPFERFVRWVSDFFSWSDIVEVKNNIVDFVNATLDYGSSNLDWAANKVDSKFDGWKAIVKQSLAPGNIPDKVGKKSAGPKAQKDVPKDASDKMKQADVKQNWTKYQLTHGGALRGSSIEGAIGSNFVKQYQDTWDTVVKPMFDSLSDSVETIMHDVSLLFKQNSDITPAEILQKLGVDVVISILDAVKTLLVGLLKRLAHVVDDFKALVNKKIKIPIFSDLWVLANKVFNKDVEAPTFTVIGFIGFVLAIPLTLTCKLFTGGKKPPAPKFNVKTLSAFFDNSAPESDKKSYNGFAAMLETGAASMLAIVGLASTVGLGGALAAIFDFQLLFGLIRVAVCIPTNKNLPLWEVRCAVSAADAVNVFILAIARKVDKGGKGEQVLAVIEGSIALLNIGLHTAVNVAELTEEWQGKDEERTGYQILISVLGGVSTIGKNVSTISMEPNTKLAGVVAKQVAGKAAGFFNVVNTYSNIGKGKYTYILNSGS